MSRRRPLRLSAAVLALAATVTTAQAQQQIGSYRAYIGQQDLFNSQGVLLAEPWQVLRQERANYHRFNIRQPGDEWDPFFADIANREAMERLVRAGSMDPVARKLILKGDSMILVRIMGAGGRITALNIEVGN